MNDMDISGPQGTGGATGEELELADKLAYHLQYNHWPPVTVKMIPYCLKAIQLCSKGEPEAVIMYPNGSTTTAAQLVDECHLQWFLTMEEAG